MSSSSTARSSCPCSTTPVLWRWLPPPSPWPTASACGWSPRVSRPAPPTPSWPGWGATRRRATTCPDPCPPPSLTTGCEAGAPSTSSPGDWTSRAPSWTGGSGCCPAHEKLSAPGWSGRWDCSPLPTLPLEPCPVRDGFWLGTAGPARSLTAFPVIKTIEEFDLAASSIPAPAWDYLTSLEWIGAKENLALIGPAGTGKSHTLIALGHAAVHAGHRVRYFTAPDLVEILYRGLADNSVGKVIDTLLRNDLLILDGVGFAPLDDTGTQLLFRLVAAAYERRSLAIASHWSFEDWGRFLPCLLYTSA